jgi:hypothetical protein
MVLMTVRGNDDVDAWFTPDGSHILDDLIGKFIAAKFPLAL